MSDKTEWTVGELIEHLQSFDPNLEVWCFDQHGEFQLLFTVKQENRGEAEDGTFYEIISIDSDV